MKEEELRRLIQLMKKNDGKAFEEFFNMLYPRFYRYAFLYIKSDVMCEELVSNVFLKPWNFRISSISCCQFWKREIRDYMLNDGVWHAVGRISQTMFSLNSDLLKI